MMLLGPSQQTHGWCRVPLRWVLLPDGDGCSAPWRQTSRKTTGDQGSAWGFLLYQKDVCLVLSFYRFSHMRLAGGRCWRTRGGCPHVAAKTKLCETTGSSTIPARPGNSHCQFHHSGLAGSTCPEAICGAPQECLWLPRVDHNVNSRSHRAGWGQQREITGGKRCRKLPEETGKQRRGRMWVYIWWHQRRL